MSGVYPVLEADIPGLEPGLSVSGRALSRELETLETLADLLHIPPLMQFFSTNADEVAGLMGLEEGDVPSFPVKEEWFDCTKGLVTVRRLQSHIHANPDAVEQAEWVLDDLSAVECALVAAEQCGIRFHFTIDI